MVYSYQFRALRANVRGCGMARIIRNVLHSVISEDERRRRQGLIDYARASVGLEGFIPSAEAEELARRYVNGEIDMAEFVKVSDDATRPW